MRYVVDIGLVESTNGIVRMVRDLLYAISVDLQATLIDQREDLGDLTWEQVEEGCGDDSGDYLMMADDQFEELTELLEVIEALDEKSRLSIDADEDFGDHGVPHLEYHHWYAEIRRIDRCLDHDSADLTREFCRLLGMPDKPSCSLVEWLRAREEARKNLEKELARETYS